MLGVPLAVGRRITPEDDTTIDATRWWCCRTDSGNGALRAKRRSSIKTVLLNGQKMTVLGVAAKSFQGTDRLNPPDLFVPVTKQRLLMPSWYGLDSRKSSSSTCLPGCRRANSQHKPRPNSIRW